jgi:two-component system chemotaxis response regulator CheY
VYRKIGGEEKMRILVAEDDLVSRQFMSKSLARYGECITAADGMEALEVYLASVKKGDYFDLICLDIMMPRTDGIRVLRIIRKLEKRDNFSGRPAKIILLAAMTDKNYAGVASKAGGNAYVSKPLDDEHLEKVMKKLELI